jgi:SPX domain protein involved in polyphosphate accumulation
MKEKKDQRFFERTLDNNLENLYNFLLEKNNELVEQASKEMGEGLEKALAQDPGILDAIATKNSEKYIFGHLTTQK